MSCRIPEKIPEKKVPKKRSSNKKSPGKGPRMPVWGHQVRSIDKNKNNSSTFLGNFSGHSFSETFLPGTIFLEIFFQGPFSPEFFFFWGSFFRGFFPRNFSSGTFFRGLFFRVPSCPWTQLLFERVCGSKN